MSVDSDGGSEPVEETERVRDLIEERIDGSIESICWHSRDGGTHYGLVVSTRREAETLSITSILLDTADESLRILGDNSMWIPGDRATLDALIQSLARSSNSLGGSIPADAEPIEESLTEFSAEEIGAHEISDDYEPFDPSVDWKEREGVDGIETVHERLREAPIETADRLIRLEFERKAPWSGEHERVMRPPEEIGGNYGVEVSEDDDLVILDIDDVETAIEAGVPALPETLSTESPHGGRHLYFVVPGWLDAFREEFGVENPHPSYGEIRSQDGYVVGAGCILTDCKHDCCTEEDPGEYQLIDAPIAEIAPEDLIEVIDR
jgi:hypothetical protein